MLKSISHHSFKKSHEGGFTLTEMLIVIVVIGILVLLAVPRYGRVVTKAKSTEAKIALEHLHSLEKAYYFEHDRYTNSLEEIGFEQEKLVTEGGKARYKIEIINADETGFKARATAVVDFDKDGVYDVWEIDDKGEIKQVVAD